MLNNGKRGYSKPDSKSEGLNMSYHGDHVLQKNGIAKQISTLAQAKTPNPKQVTEPAIEAMFAEAGLPESWQYKQRLNFTVITLCRLDPMRWRYDRTHDVWRYYMDGGMTIVVANRQAPDIGVLVDCHDAIILPVVWTDNLVPEAVKKYWSIVFQMDELLNGVEYERDDLTERILEVRELLANEGREEEGKIPRLPKE